MFIQLKNLLNEILNEIGEGSSKPFEYSQKTEDNYTIHGTTSKGNNIDILLNAMVVGNYMLDDRAYIPGRDIKNEFKDKNGMYVSFNIQSINGEVPDKKYDEIDDVKYMFRLMATLKEIMLPIIQKEDINFMIYSPSSKVMDLGYTDKGKGRDILYSLFLKREFPNAEVHGTTDKRLIILNR